VHGRVMAPGFVRGLTYRRDSAIHLALIQSRFMPGEACAARVTLSSAIVVAVSNVYRARPDYESAKQKRAANTDALSDVLQRARDAERIAVRELDEHVRQHGCKA